MIWPDHEPATLVLFALLCAAVLLGWLYAWRRRLTHAPGLRFPARERLAHVPARGWRARLAHLPLALRLAALALMLIALTRPQLPEAETAEVEGIDIVVAFDMSGSMRSVDISDEDLVRLRNDGAEPRDRFTSAVKVLRDFISTRRYDRVSLVVFGKEAFLQFPLTLDYGVMLDILDRLELGDIDGSGTAIGNALAMSLARLRESEAKTRLVILITDGDDNGSQVSPIEMAKEAAERDVRVFTILVGSEDQTRQPTDSVDFFTGQRVYRKVENDVNPELLQQIAEAAGGRFYRSENEEALAEDFVEIIDEFEKSRLVDYAAAERDDIYHAFLLPALALLLLEILLSQTLLRRFP